MNVNKTPTELLIELGRALHGEHWVGPTARDLGVRRDTVHKWLSGRRPLREGPLLAALRELVEEHRRAVARVRARQVETARVRRLSVPRA